MADVIIPPALREGHRRGLAHYLATGDGPVLGTRVELTGLRADGLTIDVESSISRMPGAGPPMFTGFLRDITDRKQADQKLQAQLARLELLNRITRAIGERRTCPASSRWWRRQPGGQPADGLRLRLPAASPRTDVLTVTSVGAQGPALAAALA